jgi:hypothetical protein
MEKTHWAWLPGRLRSAPVGRDRTHHLIGGHAARQGANVAIFERPLRPEGDLDRLFAVGGHGGAGVAILGGVDDPDGYSGELDQ